MVLMLMSTPAVVTVVTVVTGRLVELAATELLAEQGVTVEEEPTEHTPMPAPILHLKELLPLLPLLHM